MNSYENFLEGKSYTNTVSEKDCVSRKKEYNNCFRDKKNELTKTTTDWSKYAVQVRELVDDCYDSNNLGDCKNYFSKFELNY